MNNDWEFDYSGNYNNPYAQQQMPTLEPKKKKSGAKHVLAAVALVTACGVVSVGGGYLGASLGGKNSTVLYQAPPTSEANTAQGSGISANVSGGGMSVSQIAAKAGPSVVEVVTEGMQTDSFFGQRIVSGAGSGVIISEDGYIITNNHVVEGATNIKVTLSDKNSYEAKVMGVDAKTDIAVIKVDAKGLPAATIGNSDNLIVGEETVVIGNPMGTLGGSVTNGIISALNRDIVVGGQTMNLLQTNAAVSPGNSGGGLFNGKGELIGIVNAKSAGTGSEGIGFAIPINTAIGVATDLMNKGYVSGRPAMGISVLSVDDVQTAIASGKDSLGVFITKVNDGGAADKAGLKVNDRFISVNDTAVQSMKDISSALDKCKVGDKIKLQVARGGQVVSTELVLEEMQQPK
ncbi:MAG: trypsin-like peptidase domain-containing protein [Oscillospiraceae bacterium]